MKFEIRKSYYGSTLLEIEANSEAEALAIAEDTYIDLDENLGDVSCEVERIIHTLEEN
jgi:hypothetical protein